MQRMIAAAERGSARLSETEAPAWAIEHRMRFERLRDGHQRVAMGWSEDEVPEFVKDPLAYAEETHRMAEELQRHIFPPWRWPGWYRRRRVIEERLHNLQVLQRAIEESEHDGG